jgi:hypothetical protein
VKAIIAPHLYVPLLLGLPFLVANHIIIDFATHTTIDKRCNYDLLNPPHKPNRIIVDEHQECRAKNLFKKEFGVVLLELISVCHDLLAEGKCIPEDIKPLNVTGLIRDCIEILAFQEKVRKFETKFLSEFHDVFEPLPHVDKLPTNVMAQIRMLSIQFKLGHMPALINFERHGKL